MSQPNSQTSLLERRQLVKHWLVMALLAAISTTAAAIYLQSVSSSYTGSALTISTLAIGVLVFVFGVSSWSKFIKGSDTLTDDSERPKRATIVFHGAGLIIGYYLASVVANLGLFSLPPNTSWIENLGRIILFMIQSTFPGVILVFALLTLSLLGLRRVYYWLTSHFMITLTLSLILFLTGWLLSQLGINNNLLTILTGNAAVHSYPLMQYLGIYLFGLYWGRRQGQAGGLTLTALLNAGLFAALTISAILAFNQTPLALFEPLRAFTPSLTFLSIILFVAFLSFLVIKPLSPLLSKLNFIAALSRYEYDLIIFPVITALILVRLPWRELGLSTALTLVLFIFLTLLISLVLSFLRGLLVQETRTQVVARIGFNWKVNDKLVLILLWMILIFSGAVFVLQNYGGVLGTGSTTFTKLELTEEGALLWWDHNFDYFRPILIENSDPTREIPRNTWYKFEFNHDDYVISSRARQDGGDLRIVYYDPLTQEFSIIPFILDGANTRQTGISFKLQDTIPAAGENQYYFFYYGNPDSLRYPASQEAPVEVVTTGIALLDEQKHLITAGTDRRWYLKPNQVTESTHLVEFTASLDPTLPSQARVSYEVLGTELKGTMQRSGTDYRAEIDVTKLKPGYYEVQASAVTIDTRIKLHHSRISNIAVSDPIYVTWTLDWEGWDVPDLWLQGLEDMAKKYNIPMTHFFNPRIYITSQMPAGRAQLQTDWVKRRMADYGDEIQLHLHMWDDLVQAAGVEPKENEGVSWVITGDGYNVPTYAYSVEELEKIFNWSKAQFLAHGLPTPEIFRAGLWMAGENVLQALENTGFLGDSSGRTAFNVGDPPVPWHLHETAQPYQPNKFNMNSSHAPHFDLWEFPNNGADAYWFSGEQMIERFHINYPGLGGPLTDARTVTFLSHPQFWLIDQPKLELLFSYISDFSFNNDKGPVVFTTLKNTLPEH